MTKPLQGSTFKKFRDQIMGVVPAQDPGPRTRQGPEKKENETDEGKQKGKVWPRSRRVNETTGVCWLKDRRTDCSIDGSNYVLINVCICMAGNAAD